MERLSKTYNRDVFSNTSECILYDEPCLDTANITNKLHNNQRLYIAGIFRFCSTFTKILYIRQ